METSMSTYKLEQAGKVFLFTTSIVGDNIRLACKNVSSPKNKKCSRDFSIEKLHKLDKLFNVLKTPIQAIQYIDEALRQQKVGVTEENNLIKITFYITTKGITNQIDIPLGDSNSEEISTNGQEYIQQTEHIENYETTNIVQDINIMTNIYKILIILKIIKLQVTKKLTIINIPQHKSKEMLIFIQRMKPYKMTLNLI